MDLVERSGDSLFYDLLQASSEAVFTWHGTAVDCLVSRGQYEPEPEKD